MGIYAIKPKFQKLLTPVKNLFIRQNVHPTTINLLGLLSSIICGVALFYAESNLWLLLLAPILALVRTGLNALDGLVARELNVPNKEYGEVLNEFLDRVSDVVIFVGIGFAVYANIVLGAITIILILLNSYLSIVSKAAGGKRQYGGVMGKADRMLYLGIFAIVLYLTNNFALADYFLIFISSGMVVTILQRFKQIHNELT